MATAIFCIKQAVSARLAYEAATNPIAKIEKLPKLGFTGKTTLRMAGPAAAQKNRGLQASGKPLKNSKLQQFVRSAVRQIFDDAGRNKAKTQHFLRKIQ